MYLCGFQFEIDVFISVFPTISNITIQLTESMLRRIVLRRSVNAIFLRAEFQETQTVLEPPPGKYLVLGSTGLMGSHFLLRLNGLEKVEILATYNRTRPRILGENITYGQIDLVDRAMPRDIFKDIDYVLMFAGILSTSAVLARDPVHPVMSNLLMTSHVLEAAYAEGVKKVVLLTSTTGYPRVRGKLKEEDMFEGNPPDQYYGVGWTSRFMETLCRMYAEKLPKKMLSIALRPSMIYGEYDNFSYDAGHFLPVLMRRVIERQNPIPVKGNGLDARDVVYAGDVVEACLRALAQVDRFDAFNIAYGKSFTVNQLLDMIIEIDGFEGARIEHSDSTVQGRLNRSFDTRKAESILGYRAKTSVKEGIKKTMHWYRDTHPEGETR